MSYLVRYSAVPNVISSPVQCNPFITICLGSIEMDCVMSEHVIKGQFYKGIMKKNVRFPLNPFKYSMVKKFGSNNMTMLQ